MWGIDCREANLEAGGQGRISNPRDRGQCVGVSGGRGKKWSDSGYILNVEPPGLLDGLIWNMESRRTPKVCSLSNWKD